MIPQDDFPSWVDFCRKCRESGVRFPHDLRTPAGIVESGKADTRFKYLCGDCGHEWTCSYQTDQFDIKRWMQENVRNGAWPDTQDFSDVITAGDLLEQRQCSPQCLLALNDEARGCSCRCGGKYHGSLLNAELPKPSPPWWEKALLHYPPDERARIYIDRGRVDKFNRWWAARKRDDMVAVWVRRVSSEDWTVVGDTWSSANWAVSVDTACWANAMFTMLLHARRVREVETWPVDRQWVDPGHFTLAGFSSQEEAVLVAAVVRECLWDNWAGANQCVGLLRDRFNLGHVEVLLPEK